MNNKNNQILIIFKSILISYILTGICLFILAFILYKLELSASKIRIGVVIIYIIANLAGGFYLGRKKGVRKYLWGGLNGIIYFVILLIVSLVVSESMNQDITGITTALAACLGGGTVGGMIS